MSAFGGKADIIAGGGKSHDRRRTAVGLLTVMQTLLVDDTTGRIALAILMSEAIGELLSGIPDEQLPIDVRWWN
jgi:hypothetical protein